MTHGACLQVNAEGHIVGVTQLTQLPPFPGLEGGSRFVVDMPPASAALLHTLPAGKQQQRQVPRKHSTLCR